MNQQIQMGQTISTPNGSEEYIIKEKLGQGSSGSIYLVELASKDNKQQLKQQYAMKVQNLMQKNEEEIIKLLQNHPCDNLLNIKKYWNSNGKNYIIMDLAAGGNLYDFMQKKSLEPREVQDMFRQLCLGVQQLHKLNIIHRDLKPENILLTQPVPPFNLKICDYGLSKQQTNTQTMQIGTIYYMAPELLQEKGSYDSSIDIWALGCIWYSLVAKVDLFTGSSQLEIYNSIFYAQQENINNQIQKLNLQDWEKQLMKSMINIESNQRLKIKTIVEKINQNRSIISIKQPQNQNQTQTNPQIQKINPLVKMNISNIQQPVPSQNESINLTGENLKYVQKQFEEMKSEINSLKQLIKDSKAQSTLQFKEIEEKIHAKSQQINDQEILQIKSQVEYLLKSDQSIQTQQSQIENKLETNSTDLIQKYQEQHQQIEELLKSDKQLKDLKEEIEVITNNIEKIQTNQQQNIEKQILQFKSQVEELLKSVSSIQIQQSQIENKLETNTTSLGQINTNYQQQIEQIVMIQTNQQQINDQQILSFKSQIEQLLQSDQSIQAQQSQIENKVEINSTELFEKYQEQHQQIEELLKSDKQLKDLQKEIKLITNQYQITETEILQIKKKSQIEQLLKLDSPTQIQQSQIENKIDVNINTFDPKQINEQQKQQNQQQYPDFQNQLQNQTNKSQIQSEPKVANNQRKNQQVNNQSNQQQNGKNNQKPEINQSQVEKQIQSKQSVNGKMNSIPDNSHSNKTNKTQNRTGINKK